MAPLKLLAAWQRCALYGSIATLLLSGVLWLAVHYSVGAGAGELPNPLEPWSMRMHGAAAFAALFAFGAAASSHVPSAWRISGHSHSRNQRSTGLVLCLLASILVLTGYALYYFAPDALRPAIGWFHSGAGIALGAMLACHRRRTVRPVDKSITQNLD